MAELVEALFVVKPDRVKQPSCQNFALGQGEGLRVLLDILSLDALLPRPLPGELPKNCRRIAEELPKNCRRIAEELPKNCQRIAKELPK
ncbi:MAG: hypothetical protein O7D86_06160, partial [Proteobacteria bacterium]|nr:hypothetical protein [Pseudomonadota bacterium]